MSNHIFRLPEKGKYSVISFFSTKLLNFYVWSNSIISETLSADGITRREATYSLMKRHPPLWAVLLGSIELFERTKLDHAFLSVIFLFQIRAGTNDANTIWNSIWKIRKGLSPSFVLKSDHFRVVCTHTAFFKAKSKRNLKINVYTFILERSAGSIPIPAHSAP